MYTKEKGEPLNFIECLHLLRTLEKSKIIQVDPNNKDNLLIYRKAGDSFPEGWYSENIFNIAQDLVNNADDQRFLEDVLEKRGIALTFEILWPAILCDT